MLVNAVVTVAAFSHFMLLYAPPVPDLCLVPKTRITRPSPTERRRMAGRRHVADAIRGSRIAIMR